jgi:hypothetical protein
MKSFIHIFQRGLGIDVPQNKPDEYWQHIYTENTNILHESDIHGILCFYVGKLLQHENYVGKILKRENKFRALDELLSNQFLTEDQRERILSFFAKMQRVYHAMARFAYRFRYYAAKTVIDHDLCMNPIDPTKASSIVIFQDGSKYVFKLSDIINIIQTALTHSTHFFSDAYEPKNPYNQIPFSKSILYSIYFQIRRSSYRMPALVEAYFTADFEMDVFLHNNEELIRDEYIKNRAEKSCHVLVIDDIYEMIRIHGYTENPNYTPSVKKSKRYFKLSIDEEFPDETMANIMRPYLKLFYFSRYSLHTVRKRHAYNELKERMNAFVMYNPNFGRIRFMKQSVDSHAYIKSFNTDHINFHVKNWHVRFYDDDDAEMPIESDEDENIVLVDDPDDDEDDEYDDEDLIQRDDDGSES